VAIALTAVFLGPIVLIVLTAFMTSGQTLTSDLWPHEWQLSNFRQVFVEAPFLTWLKNSLVYSVLATGFMLLPGPGTYALARLKWRGRNLCCGGDHRCCRRGDLVVPSPMPISGSPARCGC
jgi:multiple sugar transport system permease protein